MSYLTIPEAAQRLKVSIPTVRRWIRSGRVRSQLTLGPFGEQWMVDPESLDEPLVPTLQRQDEEKPSSAFVPVQELTQPPPDPAGNTEELLREAEQALEQACRVREQLERELQELRAELSARSERSQTDKADLIALRCDLEGSERERLRLERERNEARRDGEQAHSDLRSCLQSLREVHRQLEQSSAECQRLRAESLCVRRLMAQKLGLEGEDVDLLSLFFQWEAAQLRSIRPVSWGRRRGAPELEHRLEKLD